MMDTTIERYTRMIDNETRIQNIVIVGVMVLFIALLLSLSGCMGIQAPVGLTGMPKIDIPVTQPPNNFYENPSAIRPVSPIGNVTNKTSNVTVTVVTTKPKFLYV